MWTGSLRKLVVASVFLPVAACGGSDPSLQPWTPQVSDVDGGVRTPVTATAAAVPPDAPAPPPEAAAGAESWVVERILAVADLYGISTEGLNLLLRLDVRQMLGQPGFFGSYGYKGWTGVGEAKPAPIMHELGHAYWGAFPVTGRPELTWETPDEGGLSTAMEAYRRDVLDFMGQPLGHYELFRSYLRNIPGLSAEKLDGLWHSVEADVVGNVAGDLDLLPPILRKYWDRFMEPGPWSSWYEAAAWFGSLDGDQAHLASQYMGFQHLDLREYGPLPAPGPGAPLERSSSVLEREERQRLWDFADQLELLLGAPEYEENFDFWRGYLREMQRLYHRNPGYLETLALPRASAIAESLSFLRSLEERDPESRAEAIAQRIIGRPFLIHFLPALDNRTLLALLSAGAPLPETTTLKGTAAFVSRLERLAPAVNEVLATAREDSALGAASLARFLDAQDFEERRDLRLFFELLRDADGGIARETTGALDGPTKRRLLEAVPAETRALLDPGSLLDAVAVTDTSGLDEMARGIDLLIQFPSGNYRVDEPYLAEVYGVVAARAEHDREGILRVMSESRLPLERFIRDHPAAAASILAADLDLAAGLVEGSDPVVFPPARFVYRLIAADPAFAARLVAHLDARGERGLVVESLAHFAYDADRLAAAPGLPVSLEADGRFLDRLLSERGRGWLLDRLSEAVRAYALRVGRGEVPGDFLRAYPKECWKPPCSPFRTPGPGENCGRSWTRRFSPTRTSGRRRVRRRGAG